MNTASGRRLSVGKIVDGGLPRGEGVAADIRAAVGRLRGKLAALDPKAVGMSEYSANYLIETLAGDAAQLNVNAHVLFCALRDSHRTAAQTTIVDYGGGNGLLSLLAREAGVGTIVFNDIFEGSCIDSRLLAKTVGLEADHYVQGDLDALIAYLRDRAVVCDTVMSYDVIEHIYDIEPFLSALPEIAPGDLRVVLASAANTLNPRRNRQLMKTQRVVEHQDRVAATGHKERDALAAYHKIRARIVRERAPTLMTSEVEQLAQLTRGLMQQDIEAVVDSFVATRRLPKAPDHPTNTCDPLTGNWAEHLMDPFRLADVLTAAGVPTQIEAGYYGFHIGLRGVAAAALNGAIHVTGRAGLRISPYYILLGDRR